MTCDAPEFFFISDPGFRGQETPAPGSAILSITLFIAVLGIRDILGRIRTLWLMDPDPDPDPTLDPTPFFNDECFVRYLSVQINILDF
jgi:hypothetical protein